MILPVSPIVNRGVDRLGHYTASTLTVWKNHKRVPPTQEANEEMEDTEEGFEDDLHMRGSQEEEKEHDGQECVDIRHSRSLPGGSKWTRRYWLRIRTRDEGGIGGTSHLHVEVTNLVRDLPACLSPYLRTDVRMSLWTMYYIALVCGFHPQLDDTFGT